MPLKSISRGVFLKQALVNWTTPECMAMQAIGVPELALRDQRAGAVGGSAVCQCDGPCGGSCGCAGQLASHGGTRLVAVTMDSTKRLTLARPGKSALTIRSLVRAWMAHHQGMILLSIGNFLCGNIVQQWFHGDAQVRATELLLQERPIRQHVRPGEHVRLSARAVRSPRREPRRTCHSELNWSHAQVDYPWNSAIHWRRRTFGILVSLLLLVSSARSELPRSTRH